jgi:hypothetical protein
MASGDIDTRMVEEPVAAARPASTGGGRPSGGLESLAENRPDLAGEWHPSRNDGLGPDEVSAGSNRRVWWRCAAGHEWEAQVGSRARGGTGCPFCAGRRPTENTCLAAVEPRLAAEWHPTLNGAATPDQVGARSNRLAWWRCEEGHVWAARIRHRAEDQAPCPECMRGRMRPEAALATVAPALAAEWHPTRNGGLRPEAISPQSTRSVVWRCAAGHEWSARILTRARHDPGCPVCAGRSLDASHPQVARAWHPSRNGDLAPSDVSAGSGRAVWWRCPDGHEWQRPVRLQVAWPSCPHCRALTEPTPRRRWGPLSRSHPALVAEWHPERNGDLHAGRVSAGSKRRVWWRCALGHEWEAPVDRRAIRGTGCPACAGKRAPLLVPAGAGSR